MTFDWAMIEMMELMNAKHLLERSGYFIYERPRPVVTATVALFYRSSTELLVFLGRRNHQSSAYPGFWCLPGGKLDAMGGDQTGETVQRTALREVHEETGIRLRHDQLSILLESSDPLVDPRGHFVNLFYTAEVDEAQHASMQVGSDLIDGNWFTYREAFAKSLAFDHDGLLAKAQTHMRGWE